jgi:hypothetical protein
MTFKLSRPLSWLALLALSVFLPLTLVMSCSSDDKGFGLTKPVTPVSTNGPVIGGNIINVCGDAGCGSISTVGAADAACDGGAAITILGFNNPKDMLKKPTGKQVAQENPGTGDGCNQVIDWGGADSGVDAFVPPTKEDYACPAGTTRVHVRDIWSKLADPTLGKMDARPQVVMLIDETWSKTGARAETASCDWYSVCVPPTFYKFRLSALATSCAQDNGETSGLFDISSFASATDVWIEYTGTSSTISGHYGSATVGSGAFNVTATKASVQAPLCEEGAPPSGDIAGYTRIHVRYPWGDPAKTGFQGSACEDEKIGTTSPPYPTTLKVSWQGLGATGTESSCGWGLATLDLQNSHCPWYTMYVPDSAWSGTNVTFKVSYDVKNQPALETGNLTLPTPKTQKEYWLAYTGPTDDVAWSGQGTPCMNWSTRPDSMHFFTQNPGPGYVGCGGDSSVASDPCNPPSPPGYHNVHFRYIWAGQKIFTFFPALDLMPRWIIMEVTPKTATADLPAVNITCTREADRPWFVCQIPDGYFAPGTTWRAVDKTNIGVTEWNTVTPRSFPTEAKEWWIRWYYGKPDYPTPRSEAVGQFKAFDYYPDGVGGDWSATGVWNDQACAAKPPSTSVKLGYGGWFPYNETGYTYPFGASLSITYPSPSVVQSLFNFLVQERYEVWKQNYLKYDDDACGVGTARVDTEPGPTVSEGQGYGMAISAAIGDKPTFDKLWKFTRHFLSKSSKKYCGGLMGWIWKGASSCRPLDSACDPDTEDCPGDGDSAFDGDVDIGIGLVYAALQWPEYRQAAISWILKMECEMNPVYESPWIFPASGDTWDKNCQYYEKGNPNSKPCTYTPGSNGNVFVDYYPPGYFRVFGDFLYKYLAVGTYTEEQKSAHRAFWYKGAESVYELYERCYDQAGIHPGLVSDMGTWATPCAGSGSNYDWARYLWRVGIDAAWFGNRTDLPENQPGSSKHYSSKSRMQAKIDNIQEFFNNFYLGNPVEPNANRFSSICGELQPSGTVTNCDPGGGHNSYFVGSMASAYVSVFDNDGKTTGGIRREAVEEAISTAIMNDKYFQESLGVYSLLFLTGNFPNPLTVK